MYMYTYTCICTFFKIHKCRSCLYPMPLFNLCNLTQYVCWVSKMFARTLGWEVSQLEVYGSRCYLIVRCFLWISLCFWLNWPTGWWWLEPVLCSQILETIIPTDSSFSEDLKPPTSLSPKRLLSKQQLSRQNINWKVLCQGQRKFRRAPYTLVNIAELFQMAFL